MSTLRSLILGIPLLILLGCTQQPTTTPNTASLERIETLESRISELEAQINDQQMKTRIAMMKIHSNPMFNSTLEDFFFASDMFWRDRLDPDNVDDLTGCQNGCIEAAQDRRKTCMEKPEGPERIRCIDESSKQAQGCQAACIANYPYDFNFN